MSKAVRGFSADWVSPGAAIKRQKEKKQELDIERKSLVKIMIYSTLKFQILFLYKVKPSSFGLFIGEILRNRQADQLCSLGAGLVGLSWP